jgi:hypothetical protein
MKKATLVFAVSVMFMACQSGVNQKVDVVDSTVSFDTTKNDTTLLQTPVDTALTKVPIEGNGGLVKPVK